MEEDECGVAARLFALLRCVDHLGEAKASRVFSSNEKECIFMSEPNANAIKNPSRPATNVRTITSLAMLAAIAYVVMLLSKMLPQVSGFLQMDLKDTVICIGAFLFGPLSAAVISIVVAVVEMFTVSDTGILGCIMNILSTCAFACTASAIYRKKRTLAGAVAGLAAGCAVMVSAMLLWNYLITPLYMGYPREAVAELLLPAFLPFNLLKSGLNAGITFLLYKPVVSSLRKSGLIDAPSGPAARRPVGLLLLAAVLVATCVLILLARNGLL